MSNESSSTYRILDAAANRAGEAARVVEDYVRFVLDDGHLTERCKQLRHDLADGVRGVDLAARNASRETTGDVGCEVTTAAEAQRTNTREVCVASFKRLQQSLRSLEEFSKTIDSETASRFEQFRYESYTLEKAALNTDLSQERLEGVRLCVLVDGRGSLAEFQQLVKKLVDAEVGMIQLRDKRLDDRELVERARAGSSLTEKSQTQLIINDRADVAALVHADGVHVGQEDLSVKDARSIVGSSALVGVSTHSVKQARQAVLDGASYIGVGPVFSSTTKSFDELKGTTLLAEVAAEITLPSFAIGGIDRENIDQVVDAGIRRVAVGQAVVGAENPGEAARQLLKILNAERVTA